MISLISIVIPTHNRSDLLQRALDSVLNQTYGDFEIIVVSDGSTDNTDEIMANYQDERINYISYHPSRGGNVARNTGIKAAKYDYIAFLDDDDEWHPTKLQKQLNVFNENENVGLVYTGVNTIYVDEQVSYYSIPDKTGNLSKDILLSNSIGTTSTVMVKKEILNETGYFDEKLKAQQDYDLWIRVCQKTEIGAVKEACVKYSNYPGTNQISQQLDKYIESMSYIQEKYKTLFSKFTDKEMNDKRSNESLFLATKSMRKNNGKLTRKYSKKAFKFSPSLKPIFYYLVSGLKYSSILKLRSIL